MCHFKMHACSEATDNKREQTLSTLQRVTVGALFKHFNDKCKYLNGMCAAMSLTAATLRSAVTEIIH